MNREERYIHFFSHLTANDHEQFNEIFALRARFKDPFNDVIGVVAIQNVFAHMFATTDKPKFIVNHYASKQNKLFLQWQFTFSKNNKKWNIDGTSLVTFNENDRVSEHIDYWDPAEQIYSKIPLLKTLMNFLRAKLTAQ